MASNVTPVASLAVMPLLLLDLVCNECQPTFPDQVPGSAASAAFVMPAVRIIIASARVSMIVPIRFSVLWMVVDRGRFAAIFSAVCLASVIVASLVFLATTVLAIR